MPRQTVEEVVPPHLDPAFNYARCLTKSEADAEDVVRPLGGAIVMFAVSLGGSVEVVRFARARHIVETTASVADEVVGDHVRALRDAHLPR
jgi:hypothetical protein